MKVTDAVARRLLGKEDFSMYLTFVLAALWCVFKFVDYRVCFAEDELKSSDKVCTI